MAGAPARIDLHMHSRHSDGEHAPAELVPMAVAAGLSAISLTDHDTLAGIEPLIEAARGTNIRVVTGVELSSSEGASDIHILGYLFDAGRGEIAEALDRFRAGRLARAERIVEKLKALGVAVELDQVMRHAGGEAVGRPHVARALLAGRHVASFDEAFRRYLGYHAPAFVPKPYLDPVEAIALLRRGGGVAVLAHPGTVDRDDMIPALVKAGLAGIEVWHPKHTPAQVAHYARVARQFGLVASGGSDFHGAGMGPYQVGMCPVPESALAELEARR